jgi:hypothetical protein
MSEGRDKLLYPMRLYREIEDGEQFVIFADPAEVKDYCAAVALSKKRFDFPLIFNEVIDSAQFGYELNNMAKYIYNKTQMYPKIAVERNTGQATIAVLKMLNYSNLFRMPDFTGATNAEHGGIGWLTTGFLQGGELQGTRRKMLDDFALVLNQEMVTLYDEQQIKQMKAFVINKGRAQAKGSSHDDLVMATTGAWQIHLATPIEFLDDVDPETIRRQHDKWRFK